MSETFDANTGWHVDDNGDAVPEQEAQGLLPDKALEFINQRNMADDPEYRQVASTSESSVSSDFDPVAGITQEQARQLNQKTQDERGGTSLTPDPNRVREVPREGRDNWSQ